MKFVNLFKSSSIVVAGINRKNPLNPGRIIFVKNFFEKEANVYGIHPDGS